MRFMYNKLYVDQLIIHIQWINKSFKWNLYPRDQVRFYTSSRSTNDLSEICRTEQKIAKILIIALC